MAATCTEFDKIIAKQAAAIIAGKRNELYLAQLMQQLVSQIFCRFRTCQYLFV